MTTNLQFIFSIFYIEQSKAKDPIPFFFEKCILRQSFTLYLPIYLCSLFSEQFLIVRWYVNLKHPNAIYSYEIYLMINLVSLLCGYNVEVVETDQVLPCNQKLIECQRGQVKVYVLYYSTTTIYVNTYYCRILVDSNCVLYYIKIIQV